jgi:hypothetical protein
VKGPRLALLGVVSLTATGLVIGSALRDDQRGEALAAAAALSRASAVAPVAAPATTAPTTTPAVRHAPAHTHTQASGGDTSASAPSPDSGQVTDTTPAAPKKKSSPAPTTPVATSKVKHVFLIVLTSPGYDATFGQGAASAPYLNQQLRPKGQLLTGYRALPGSDLPNYVAMISGQPPNAATSANCTTYSEFPSSAKTNKAGVVSGDGCVYPVDTLTLADQLTSAAHTWKAYEEDMAATCQHPDSGQPDDTQQGRPGDEYAARHNPFAYFHSLLDLGDCASNDVPLTKLGGDLASVKTTPSLSFIAPNLCHDGSDLTCADGTPGGLAAADTFLSQLVPQILASPAYKKDGLLELVFAAGPPVDPSGLVGALLVSPFITAGSTDATGYGPYSLLRTNEDIFGLGHLADAGGDKVKSLGGGFVTGAGD